MLTFKKTSRKDAFLAVGYMIFMLMTSLVPMEPSTSQSPSFSDLDPKVQNLLHIPMFGILYILLVRIFNGNMNNEPKPLILVLLFCIFFGILNELIQFFIPGRYAGLLDMGLNVIGALTGLVCWYLVLQKIRKGKGR